jgi:hypothetical protein
VADASPAPRPQRSEERVQAQADTSPKPANSTLPCHHFKPPRHTESSGPRPTPRKPPKSATPVPNGQKNAAHASKHGWKDGAGILIEAETVGFGRDGTFSCLSGIKRRQERGASRVSQVSSRSAASGAGSVVHEKTETELAGQSRSQAAQFAFTSGLSVLPKQVSRDPFLVLSAILRNSLDAPGSGAGYVDHPDEPGQASPSGRCIRGNEAQSSFQLFGW